MTLKSRSDKPFQKDTYTIQLFHTPKMNDLFIKVFEKQTKTQKLTLNNAKNMKMS